MSFMSESAAQQSGEQTRIAFGLALTELAKSDETVVAVSADTLDLMALRGMIEKHPERVIDAGIADKALTMLDIDMNGLDEMDKRILETILYKFSGGPVGVNSLAVAVGEETGTIEEVYEPYLIQEGYLQRTPQGRVATQRCHELFGQDSGTAQKELF